GRAGRVALALRGGEERAEGALRLAFLRRVVEAVALPGRAGDVARVVEQAVLVGVHAIVVLLRVDVGEAGLHRGALVAPGPPREDLVVPRVAVEAPARRLLHERGRGRPAVVADVDDGARVALQVDDVELGPALGEALARVRVGDRVARVDDRLALRPEDREQRRIAGGGDRRRERVGRIVGRREVLLRGL